MAISGVGGTPQGDPLQAQRAEAIGQWNQLGTKLKALLNELKTLKGNLKEGPGAFKNVNVKTLMDQITTIIGELKSLNDSGDLALALSVDKYTATKITSEITSKLASIQQNLKTHIGEAENQPNPSLQLDILKSGIEDAVNILKKIVQ